MAARTALACRAAVASALRQQLRQQLQPRTARVCLVASPSRPTHTRLSIPFSFPFSLRGLSVRVLSTTAAASHKGHAHADDGLPEAPSEKAHAEPWHDDAPASPHEHSHPKEKEHTASAMNITYVGIFVNVMLSGGKGVLGVLSNSQALIADAAHSFSDLLSDFVTLWGVRQSRRPATKKFPFGYGRSESVAACVVSVMLIATGAGMIEHCVRMLVTGNISGPTEMTNYAIAMAAASIVSKEALYQRTVWLAKGMDSPALHANAWHHRTDALSSIVSLGALVAQKYGFAFVDPIGGVVVAWIILKAGWQIGAGSMREILDMSTGERMHRQVAHVIRDSIGTAPFSHEYLRIRKVGPHYFVTMRLTTDPAVASGDFEKISSRVRRDIHRRLPSAREVVIELATHRAHHHGGHAHGEGCAHDHDHVHGGGHAHAKGCAHDHDHAHQHPHPHAHPQAGVSETGEGKSVGR